MNIAVLSDIHGNHVALETCLNYLKDKNIYNVIRQIKKKKIHIFLYQFPNYNEINILNRLKNNKIIFYQHSSFFFFFL